MPLLAHLLRLVLQDDHKRGCEGRNYICSCGYEAKVQDVAEEVRDRGTPNLLVDAQQVLAEVFKDHGKVASLNWTNRAAEVLERLEKENEK